MTFVAIDFETASASRASACAIGVAVVDGDRVVVRRSWLIRPRDMQFDAINMMIHGITPDHVRNEPEFDTIWQEVEPLLRGRTVLAHNAGFDMSVLRHSLLAYELPNPEIEYFCTRVLAKLAWPTMLSYALDVVCDHCGIEFDHHDAAEDARACSEIALRACRVLGATDLHQAMSMVGVRPGRLYPGGYESWMSQSSSSLRQRARDAIDRRSFDPGHPFFGQVVAFTGALASMTREDAMRRVFEVGGDCAESVTKKTQYLVVGEQDFRKLRGGTLSSKMQRADNLRAAGVPIEIIGESDFIQLLAI